MQIPLLTAAFFSAVLLEHFGSVFAQTAADGDGVLQPEEQTEERIRPDKLIDSEGIPKLPEKGEHSRTVDGDVSVLAASSLEEISRLLNEPFLEDAAVDGQERPSSVLQPYRSFNTNVTLVLTLIHSGKCAASRERVDQFQRQIPALWKEQAATRANASLPALLPPPTLVLLSVDGQEKDTGKNLVVSIEGLGITHVPALVWMIRDSHGATFVLDFSAALAPDHLTAAELLQAFGHLQSRLLVTGESLVFDDVTGDYHWWPRSLAVGGHGSLPIAADSHVDNDLSSWLQQHAATIFRPVTQVFPASLTDHERYYAEWLWLDENEVAAKEDFILLGQCQSSTSDEVGDILYDTFGYMASTWINRRNIVMISLMDCAPSNDGEIFLWRVHPEDLLADPWALAVSWESAERIISVNATANTAAEDVKNALVQVTTPSLMWLDREMSAPIAFPTLRQVHAVLVVDLHRVAPGEPTLLDHQQRAALRRFRRTCQRHQRNPLLGDVVCLVVPSLDIRVLTTFGLDIWTPMDLAVSQPAENPNDPNILPVLFVTDQRFGGTRRYYLDRDGVTDNHQFADFWSHFWEGSLTPFPKTSGRSRTNKAGIRIITEADFDREVLQRLPPTESSGIEDDDDESKGVAAGNHALVLFTSPMCGHCRRLLSLWNQFGRLVQHIGWSSMVTLYQLDVTTDEVLASESFNHTIRWGKQRIMNCGLEL